ncbi:hypothetical protein IGI04_008617 [Brassica rapa subsp. trilocularis]|uniref:Diacylglycerol kinase accessory domain-containing protein n=1 Tax=Brassica rapa subsp. trilocularis TaxID=1813537 RepID=A0ABQ7NN51_BRACM|nr:hypothetical protein IGI04_008617 [Brassica rapa subsp. trilocularis]
MGGVDLWQNDYEHDDDSFSIQSMHDKTLEVEVSTGERPFPVQIDGEPFIQQPGSLEITHHGQVFMLRRASDEPRGHVAAIMNEVLLDAECKGVINAAQKKQLLQQMALNLPYKKKKKYKFC